MTRPGFAFATQLKVRYAEIDGQKVVFNSRYLEYADVAGTDFWEWTGIAGALGPVWTETEFHVRHAEVEFLKPFSYGDVILAYVKVERLGSTSMTQLFELCHATTGELHSVVRLVTVNVHLPTGRPVPIPGPVRDFIEKLG